MSFPIPKIIPIKCDLDNSEYVMMIRYLLDFINSELEKIDSINTISVDQINEAGSACQTILLSKFDKECVFLDSDKYSEKFIGTYAQETSDLFKTLQDICQLSWSFDAYPTLELIDFGVRQDDAQNFYSYLKYQSGILSNILNQIS